LKVLLAEDRRAEVMARRRRNMSSVDFRSFVPANHSTLIDSLPHQDSCYIFIQQHDNYRTAASDGERSGRTHLTSNKIKGVTNGDRDAFERNGVID